MIIKSVALIAAEANKARAEADNLKGGSTGIKEDGASSGLLILGAWNEP
jgi:hypothetical protein